MSNLSPLDRSLHELGMLSAITDSRHQYLEELQRTRSLTRRRHQYMEEDMQRKRSASIHGTSMKRCGFHILQISRFVENISPNNMNGKRSCHRVKPYRTPVNSLFPNQIETTNERTRTKSENSDTGNENLEVKESEILVNVGLFKSKSLENIDSSSHSLSTGSRDFKMELEDLKLKTEETDVELVSSKIKCLNVSNK